MRILFLTQFYPPEIGAAQNRLSDLANRIAEGGHTVTVLTALPSYPSGEVFKPYRGRIQVDEKIGMVRVIRAWAYVTKSKGFLPRIFNYISFALFSILIGLWKVESQDVVFVEMPPLFLGISGWLLSQLKKSRFVVNVSDLWPESAVALGVLRNRQLIRAATFIEEAIYQKADLITGQTKGIVDSIRNRCRKKRIELMVNGVDPDCLLPSSLMPAARNRIRKEYGLGGKFVVGYTGLHGLAQGLTTLLESAELLHQYSDIVFAFIGDGPEKAYLCELAEKKHLGNVRFFPPQPAVRMPEIFAALDLALIPLKDRPLFRGALPSKLFEAMGAAIPVVVAISGEARELIEASQAGITVPPEDATAVADAVLRLREDENLRTRLGNNGRSFILKHHNRKQTADKFKRLVLDTLKLSEENQSL